MMEERYKRLFDKIHPKEDLVTDILAAATRPKGNRRWMIAAACTVVLVVAAVLHITLPPRDVVASNGEVPVNNDEFLPIDTKKGYGCCDVREMELNVLSSSIRDGIMFLEVELLGEVIHPEMIITWRLYDGKGVQAFHLLWDDVAYVQHGEGRITHLLSFNLDAATIPAEGKRLTLAVNNYDCGLAHDRYPHWEEEAVWEDVLPDCITMDFKVFSDGTISLMKD